MSNEEQMNDASLTVMLSEVAARDRAGTEAPELAARVMMDFDALAARPTSRWHARIAAFASRLADAAWPGAPLWKPACAIGLSLAIGLGVGAVLPFYGASEETGVAIDVPQGLDLGGDTR